MHGFTLFEERVGAKLATDDGLRAIDWSKLLQLLIPLIAGCFASPKPAQLRRRLFRFAQVSAAVRNELECTWEESRKVAGAIYDCADEATDPELQSFIDDLNAVK